ERFDLHRLALKWPRERFSYVGVNNPPEGPGLEGALAGEKSKLAAVRIDLYLQGIEWRSQREMRDPFQRRHPYKESAPELADFFRFLERISFQGVFPWLPS